MRNACAVVLVLVATLVAPLVIGTAWLAGRVDDRTRYVDTVGPLADDPDVRRLMSDAVADAAVDTLQQYLPVGLPPAVNGWAHAAADAVIEGPGFPAFWRQANGDVHDQVMQLVDDPRARAEGYVYVDASPLLTQVFEELAGRGVPVLALPQVPLRVPVARESRLVELRDAYRTTEAASSWLPLVWVGLVALAVLVATGLRARARTLGLALLGAALAAAVVMVAAGPAARIAADQAAEGHEDLAEVMVRIVLGSLTPYAGRFLLAAPLGLALVLLPTLTEWATRRSRSSVT